MTSGLRRAVLGTILLAGTLLRLEGLGRDSLWHDEGWTASLVRGSPGRLLHHLRRHDAHPPLYYLLLQAFSPLGDSEAALRLPSALAGIAAIPLLYRLVRRLYGPAPATLAALLLALSPAHVHFSQEARSYALLFLLCLASLNLLFDLRIAGGPLRGAAFAACSAAIMATHYMGAFFLLSEGLAVLLIVWIAHDPNRLHVITRREHQWMFAYLVMSLALFGLGGGKCSMDLRKKRREGT